MPGGVRRGADWRGAGLIGGYLASLDPTGLNGKGGEVRHGGKNEDDIVPAALSSNPESATRNVDLMAKHGELVAKKELCSVALPCSYLFDLYI